MTANSNPPQNSRSHRSQITASSSEMALQVASVVFLFLSCLLFPNGAAQTLFESWTVAFDINASDPREVQRHAEEVKALVSSLTDQIRNLSDTLNAANSTDYAELQTLLTDVDNLANNITDITTQYNAAVVQKDAVNSTLEQISATLHCFADAGCVTGGPTTTPFTGPTTPHPCSPSPCQNGGTCSPNGAGHTCNCSSPFFTGTNCEIVTCAPSTSQPIDLNAMQQFPPTPFPRSLNGLNCWWRIRTQPGQYVNVTVKNVTFVGSAGLFQVIDPLAGNSSLFNATESTSGTDVTVQTSLNSAVVYFNTAAGGVSGEFLVQLSPVASDPCSSLNCAPNGTCVANGFTAECKCHPCHTGPTCNIDEGNPCAEFGELCGTHGTCAYNLTTCRNPYCNCIDGYTGDFCTNAATTASSFRYYKLYDMPDSEK